MHLLLSCMLYVVCTLHMFGSHVMTGNIGKGVLGSSKKGLLFVLIRDHSPHVCAKYVPSWWWWCKSGAVVMCGCFSSFGSARVYCDCVA
jgi:hypothetical protein